MTNEIKQRLRCKDAWSNLDSEVLRKVYWRINKEVNNPRLKKYVTPIEIVKMEIFKEILIERLEW